MKKKNVRNKRGSERYRRRRKGKNRNLKTELPSWKEIKRRARQN